MGVVVVDATLSNYLPRVCCFVVENGVRCSIRGRRFGFSFSLRRRLHEHFQQLRVGDILS